MLRGERGHDRVLDYSRLLEDTSMIQHFRGGIMPEHNNGLPRVGHTIVVYKHDIYLFGGCGPKNTYSNDIFCNVKMTLQWKELRGIGVVPSGRANHTAIVYGNKMIIYGGNRNLEVLDDLYILNFDTLRWERIACEKDQGPGPVFAHSAVYIPPTNSMIIIGGFHQRHGNIYIAHALDIRHLVWKGICGPASVNPQHIQLCSAVYHSQTSSLFVLGIVERDVLTAPSIDNPTVYIMDVFTSVWVEVTTTASPESPIPFRMCGIWDSFIRDALTLGGVYDERRQEWFFPMLLSPVENQLMRRKTYDRASSLLPSIANSMDSKLKKRSSYGILIFHLVDLTWSLVSVNFPRKVLQELTARKMTLAAAAMDRQSRHRKAKGATQKECPPLFSPTGVSRFQHKYAYAIIEPSGSISQISRKRAFVMHGGTNPEDYAMLLFTPKLKRRQSIRDSFHAFSELCEASLSQSRDNVSERSSIMIADDISDNESEYARTSHEVTTIKTTPSSVQVVGRLHRLDSDPTLLPSMPSPYRNLVSHRFAVLYHSLSSFKNDKLLPEPGCPVAVLDKEDDIKAWAENFYCERRQWIAKSVKAARDEDRIMRRRAKRNSRTAKTETTGEEFTSDSDSETSVMPATSSGFVDSSHTRQDSISEPNARDFLEYKGLELFDLAVPEAGEVSRFKRLSTASDVSIPDSICRLLITGRRNEELQRLPSAIFQRVSVGNVTDLGCAMSLLLMQGGIKKLEGDVSLDARGQRAHLRWRYLRRMVLNGEAASIVHRANIQEVKSRGINVSSTAQLALVPDLYTRTSRPRKVPTRPVPYTVPKAFSHFVRSSEMSQNGHVMYHCVKHVN